MQLSSAQESVAAAERDAREAIAYSDEVVGFLVDMGFGELLGLESE